MTELLMKYTTDDDDAIHTDSEFFDELGMSTFQLEGMMQEAILERGCEGLVSRSARSFTLMNQCEKASNIITKRQAMIEGDFNEYSPEHLSHQGQCDLDRNDEDIEYHEPRDQVEPQYHQTQDLGARNISTSLFAEFEYELYTVDDDL